VLRIKGAPSSGNHRAQPRPRISSIPSPDDAISSACRKTYDVGSLPVMLRSATGVKFGELFCANHEILGPHNIQTTHKLKAKLMRATQIQIGLSETPIQNPDNRWHTVVVR
jgi:hypothetical protein